MSATPQPKPAPSPSKRRVLGALDVNISSPLRADSLGKPAAPVQPSHLSFSAQQRDSADAPRKRAFAVMAGTAAAGYEQLKRTCLDPEPTTTLDSSSYRVGASPARATAPQQTAERADTRNLVSPTRDVPAIGTKLAATDPKPSADGATALRTVESPAASVGNSPTRAQLTRQTAETLKLRLRLAAYKLKTGQTDVPLEHLQTRPVFARRSAPVAAPTPAMAAMEPRFSASFPSSSTVGAMSSSRTYEAYSSPQRGFLDRAPRTMPTADDTESEDEFGDVSTLQTPRNNTARPRSSSGAATVRDDAQVPRLTPHSSRPREDDEDNLTGGAASGLLELRNSSQ